MIKTEYKVFKVGCTYILKVNVMDENRKIIPAGTKIRLVAIAPKVRMVTGENKDTSPYFYNAVLASQENDYANRIRENFCTIAKERK